MLKIELDQTQRMVLLEPEGHLSSQDFESLARRVDPLIAESGDLSGVLVHSKEFPGWDSFSAFVAHIRFFNDHHKHVKKVALCTDSPMGSLVETLAGHFVSAQIKAFSYDELDQAKQWLST